MSFLHKIKKGARWLHQNQSAIEVALNLNFEYSKAVLKDMCSLAKVIDEPLKVPSISIAYQVIKPLLPSKEEVIQNMLANVIKCEDEYRLISETVNFLVSRGDEINKMRFINNEFVEFSFRLADIEWEGFVEKDGICIIDNEDLYGEPQATYHDITDFANWYVDLAVRPEDPEDFWKIESA